MHFAAPLVTTFVIDRAPLTYCPNREPYPAVPTVIVTLAAFSVMLAPQTHPDTPPLEAATNEELHHVYTYEGFPNGLFPELNVNVRFVFRICTDWLTL